MNANIGLLPADAAPIEKAREQLISIPYLLLRVSTAGGAFAMGFVQTFVFARVLSPERFSIFIVVGAIGYTLWLCDLGLAKILFVNLRAAFLAGRSDERAARQATAVILFYVALALAASVACFAVMLALRSSAPLHALELALFILFITLNLAWFTLRTVSISVDLFIFYEQLELARRVINMATMLAMLAGLPLTAFLVGSNALWVVLIGLAAARLVKRGALALQLRGFPNELMSFFRLNSHSILRSGTSALSGVFVANFPYYIVPMLFGLGAAPIILEATFRIFRGSSVVYLAACDLAVPGQTRALAAGDARRLVRTTLIAAGLCCLPAGVACALLIYAGGPFFAFLLHSAATVPPAIVPVLVLLLLANIVQIVAEALLQYTGFFRSLAFIGAAVAAMMIGATGVAIVAKVDIVGFLTAYAIVFTAGAIILAIAAVRGPMRAASRPGSHPSSSGSLRTTRNAPQSPPAIPVRRG